MPVVTKKPLTEDALIDEDMVTVRLRVHRCNAARIKEYAKAVESGEDRNYSVAEVFPEHLGKEKEIALRAYRTRENLTQQQLAELSGIPQHHLSEMENGKRGIGKERARRLAQALHVTNYRVFL